MYYYEKNHCYTPLNIELMKSRSKNSTLIFASTVFITIFSLDTIIGCAQTGVLNPNDSIVVYDPNHPPVQPAYGSIAKWVITHRVSWNSSSFKSYIYKGLAFRLKFPKTYQHNVVDGKKYPVFIFFHGHGQIGKIYDNDLQLYNGGELHSKAVDNGQFDGFLLYPQNPNLGWSSTQFDVIKEIITKYLVPQVKADQWRIYVDGLSGGGAGCWQFLVRYPKLIAAALPISNTEIGYALSADSMKFTPIWQFQGGLDISPTPQYTHQLGTALLNVGSNYRYTEYPTLGHRCWFNAWAEPDYFPFMLRAHKANPWALFGRTQFCATDVINIIIGVTPGFTGYKWRKNGVLINNASANTINVTELGTYDCSILDGGVWSPWSPIPLVVSLKETTVTPNIQLKDFQSIAYPAPDTSTGVWLSEPAGFTSYEWRKDGVESILDTTQVFKATAAGIYKVKVTEKYGCSSIFSPPFNVINANGLNGPDAPFNLTATVLSKTSIQLNWSQNTAPTNNENGFEIYQSLNASSGFVLAALTQVDASSYTINNLHAGTPYYFKIRAINSNAASNVTSPVVGITQKDTLAPSLPRNLHVKIFSRTEIDLEWDASSDDVGVVAYDIYINGIKSFVTSDTFYSVYNLVAGKTYNFTIKARDFTNNISLPSNQATATTYIRGLTYKFYEGVWNTLPNYNSITPLVTGVVPNISINNNNNESEHFGYLFEGFIKIPVTGNYTFRLTSDDGSKLYIGAPYNFLSTALITNDAIHTTHSVNGTINLASGIYPIAIAYFQLAEYSICKLSWSTPLSGGIFSTVPDSVFTDGFVPIGKAPLAPSNVTATAISAKSINVSWTDNSNNETGFEVYRSTNSTGPFDKIATNPINKNSYLDSMLSPETIYYYKVKSIGTYGESGFNDEAKNSLNYAYYKGSFSSLPDFASLTPTQSGIIHNFDISASYGLDNFLYKFDGIIMIPSNNTYTFYTSSDEGSQLFIDGNLVVNNDGLHTIQEKSGTIVLSAGKHLIKVLYFEKSGSESLNIQYSSPSIAKQTIPDNALVNPANDTTYALSGVPSNPTLLSVITQLSSAIQISWTDNKSNETYFELYRSTPNNLNYQLITTLAANILSYTDTSLVGNTNYYYKIRSINQNGASGFSKEANAITLNNNPFIYPIDNKYVHFGTQLQVILIASDKDNETLTYSFANLPSFAIYTPTGNGTGILSFNPQVVDQKIYNGITVTVNDQHGGSTTTSFSLTVNDNYLPVINGSNDVSINEGITSTLSVNATDQNVGDVLTWTFQHVPNFIKPIINGKLVNFNLTPGYADNGMYTITMIVSDGKGGVDSKSFTVTVVDQTPPIRKIYINFNYGNNATGVWNNTNALPSINKTFFPFNDDLGNVTNVGIKILTNWQSISPSTGTTGVNTGNNSGIYPDAVISSFYWTSIKQTFKVTGLDTASKYNLVFFGSRAGVSDSRISQYTVNGTSVTLNAVNNSQNTVSIKRIKPSTDSSITIDMQPAVGSAAYSYINALVIEKIFDDHTAPATPKEVSVVFQNGAPLLNWTDVAYNETSYEIYRSTSLSGPFQLLKPTAIANTNMFIDTSTSLVVNTDYYYKIRAVNSYGASAFSSIQSITIPNKAPVLTITNTISVKIDSIKLVNIIATDDVGNTITFTTNGLPAFASLKDNRNGTCVLSLAPNNSQKGWYNNITITATDNFGASTTQQFSILVLDGLTSSVYINFNDGSGAQPSQGFPWNNFNAAPTAGKTLSNIKDDSGITTTDSLSILESWTGANSLGVVTGNNSGVYPDNVSLSFFYENSSNIKHINLTGLSSTKKYNLTFYASRANVTDNRTTQFTAGGQNVSLNASGNFKNTVSINALTPDSIGQISISIVKTIGSFAYLNAMVIESYTENGIPLSPSNLSAVSTSKDKIILSWMDKSNNETGFEIWRSTTASRNYVLYKTVAANITSYIDAGLASGSIYYYKVRAKANSVFSGYSNYVGGSTVAYSISINFNDGSTSAPAASGAWNNTNSLPFSGFMMRNLMNENYQLSGISLLSQSSFGGENNIGMNTGNNAGIFPDNVLMSNWFLDVADTGRLKLTGLNQAMVYSFLLMASRQGTGTRNTVYEIGNQSEILNAMGNKDTLAKILSSIPDSTGSISIKLYPQSGSAFAYINGMQILAAPSTDSTLLYNLRKKKNKKILVSSMLEDALMDDVLKEKLFAFPNPFVNDFTIKLLLHNEVDCLTVRLTDAAGRLIYINHYHHLTKGIWQQQLGLIGNHLKNGIYLLEVSGISGEKIAPIKVMK